MERLDETSARETLAAAFDANAETMQALRGERGVLLEAARLIADALANEHTLLILSLIHI